MCDLVFGSLPSPRRGAAGAGEVKCAHCHPRFSYFLMDVRAGGHLIRRARDFLGALHLLEKTGAFSGGIPQKMEGAC